MWGFYGSRRKRCSSKKSISPSSQEKDKKPAEEKLPLPDDRLVWTKAETKGQMKRLENQLSVAYKQHVNDVDTVKVKGLKADEVEEELVSANKSFSEKQDVVDAKDRLIKAKNKLSILVSALSHRDRLHYFVSIWGIVPILTAASGLIASFALIKCFGDSTILAVPVWASFVAVIGACVQIFVGVVNDYRDDCMITAYKRLWYLVILPVSFAFGFIAFLLIQAGLLNISQGQFVLNQAVNQTITTTTITQIDTNQTVTQTATQSATATNLAVPLIVCFLAGYATDWFMGLLGKITSTS
jgi:hypothetical protein